MAKTPFLSKMIGKGRITIPEAVREAKGLEMGDLVEVPDINKVEKVKK